MAALFLVSIQAGQEAAAVHLSTGTSNATVACPTAIATNLPCSYQGRFSNGPVWIELVAANLSAPLYDFAVGGATTSNVIVQGYTGSDSNIPVPSVDEQVDSFLKAPPAGVDINSTLFAVTGGANDIFFNPNISGLTSASIIAQSVAKLQKAGAQHFVLFNYYDISLIPFDSYTTPENKVQNHVFSNELGHALGALQKTTPGAVFRNLQSQLFPHLYFYGEPTDYGFDKYGAYGSCLTGVYMEAPYSECDDEDKHVFWDEYHPTRRAHFFIAQGVLKELGC